ncbi:MAG: ATP synthase F1 subunit delta [Planctomycetes bacterium]|nr:ATP synthase F1 subunit delta [Planctomycetota bacterium]
MTSKTIASRYARALLNTALPGKVDKIRQDLQATLAIYQSGTELPGILRHPMIPQNSKKEILAQILKGQVDELLIHFLEALITKRRIGILPDIVEMYNLLADESLGIVKARVRTPFPISEPQQAIIKDKLARLTGKRVIMDIEIKPALLGGLAVKIGDRVMDGSVQTRLRDLKEKLLQKA